MNRPTLQALLGLSAACFAGSEARSAVVTFDNSAAAFVLVANGNFFDVTLAPSQQANAIVGRAIGYTAVSGGGSESPQVDGISGGPSLRIATSPAPFSVTNNLGITSTFSLASVFEIGQAVGPTETFQVSPGTALFYVGGGNFHTPLLGQSPFTGFRLMLPDGPHFGWVEWRFGSGPLAGGGTVPMYQPIRWAYETEPNVPITVVPAPASAAVLASIGLFVARRRRGG